MRNINDIIKEIRLSRELSQEQVADLMNKTQSSYARIERRATKIDYDTLNDFAKAMNMSLMDVITYPERYVNIKDINLNYDKEIKAILQIELKQDKKDQVLKLVFGDNNLEILNK